MGNKLSVRIPDKLFGELEKEIEEGNYDSKSEIIREAIRSKVSMNESFMEDSKGIVPEDDGGGISYEVRTSDGAMVKGYGFSSQEEMKKDRGDALEDLLEYEENRGYKD